jgi:hypothetical protein
VHRRLSAGRDVGLEDAHEVVLEQVAMMLRRSSERIERIRPRPGHISHVLTGSIPQAVAHA